MNEVARQSELDSIYLRRNAGVETILGVLCSRSVGGHVIGVHRLPSAEQRRVLRERRAVLNDYLGRDQKRAIEAVKTMILGFSKYHSLSYGSGSRKALEGIVKQYITETKDLPTKAIEEACYLVRTGRAEFGTEYPPNVNQLYALAAKCSAGARAEAHTIDLVLGMKPQIERRASTPEERAALKAKLDAFAAELRVRHGGGRVNPVKAAREYLESIAPGALDKLPDAPRRDWRNE